MQSLGLVDTYGKVTSFGKFAIVVAILIVVIMYTGTDPLTIDMVTKPKLIKEHYVIISKYTNKFCGPNKSFRISCNFDTSHVFVSLIIQNIL